MAKIKREMSRILTGGTDIPIGNEKGRFSFRLVCPDTKSPTSGRWAKLYDDLVSAMDTVLSHYEAEKNPNQEKMSLGDGKEKK